jgi:hypothetical protein
MHLPLSFYSLGIPFLVIGLVFVFGRFFIDAKLRENTFYGLTDDRIIIKSGIFKKTIKSVNIRTISDIEYTERSDRSGTMNIGPKNAMMMWGSGVYWWPGNKPTPSLDLIPEVRLVYKMIVEIQKNR